MRFTRLSAIISLILLSAALAYQLLSKPATAQGITYALSGKAAKSAAPHSPQRKPGFQFQPVAFSNRAEPEGAQQRGVVKPDFVGANPQVRLTGRDAMRRERHSLA